MKTIGKILTGLFALFVGLTITVFAIVATYDRDELKAMASEQVLAATGRELIIDGALDFSISFSPAIVLEDVRFANAPWGTEPYMATMKRFELEVSLISLLSGNLKINRFGLVDPAIFLETDRRGNGNWELGLPAEETNAQAEDGPAINFAGVNNFSITGGTITYLDGATGSAFNVAVDELNGHMPSVGSGSITIMARLNGTPIEVAATLENRGTQYAMPSLEIVYGKSDLTGSGTLSLEGRPSLQAQFASRQIDLRSAIEGMDSAEEEAGPLVFTADPLPIEGLRSIDADIQILAEKVLVSDAIVISDMTIALTLIKGDLHLTNLSGTTFGGTVKGQARFNGSQTPAVASATLAVDDLDYGKVLEAMDISEDVDGTISMNIDLTGRGGSPRAIASGLNGKTEIVAVDGVITNRLLAIVATGLERILTPIMGGASDTKLNCFVSRMNIRNGLATSQTFAVDSTTFTVAGEGTIDLRTERIDLIFDTKTREAALVSLAVPFRVRGTLANPNASPDPRATVKAIAKIFDGLSGNKKDGGKTSTKDKISGLVGGIFGGKKKSSPAPQPAPAEPAEPVDVCVSLGVK